MSTTENLVARGRELAAGAGALAAVVAVGATLFAAPAQAAGPLKPYGVVTAKAGLSERQYPSTDSSVRGYLRHRSQVGLVCKVRTQNVRGNSVWYLTRSERPAWVSAKYVTNSGFVKYCKDVQHHRVQPSNPAKHAVG